MSMTAQSTAALHRNIKMLRRHLKCLCLSNQPWPYIEILKRLGVMKMSVTVQSMAALHRNIKTLMRHENVCACPINGGLT
jgi:hypothetical protein